MGLLIFIGAILLAFLILPAGITYGLYLCFYKRHIGKGIKEADHKLLVLATALDKCGNVVCAELFNATLITKNSKSHFGIIEQTISQVIGYNLVNGTLTKTGDHVRRWLDRAQEDHCLKAIGYTDEQIKAFKATL